MVLIDPSGGISASMVESHPIFKATLKSGETFAVDFAGRSFGWAETLTLWEDFEEQRLLKVRGILRVDMPASEMMQYEQRVQPEQRGTGIHLELWKEMGHQTQQMAIRDKLWPFATGFLGHAHAQHYAPVEDKVVKLARKVAKNMVDTEIKSVYRLYLDTNLKVQATGPQHEMGILENVWLSKKDAEKLKDTKDEKLKKIWAAHIESCGISLKESNLIPSFGGGLEEETSPFVRDFTTY